MSTTTEAGAGAEAGGIGGVRGFARAAAVALGVWFVMLVGGTALLEPTQDVLVIAPQAGTARVPSAAPVALVDAPAGFLRVRGTEGGFVRALYAGGAWLVLPARAGGCVAAGR